MHLFNYVKNLKKKTMPSKLVCYQKGGKRWTHTLFRTVVKSYDPFGKPYRSRHT